MKHTLVLFDQTACDNEARLRRPLRTNQESVVERCERVACITRSTGLALLYSCFLAAYLPALDAAGYVLRVREPDWHQHRMLRTPELDVHIHVFSLGCEEVARHLAFRNHLRCHPEDRLRYETLKRTLAKRDWSDMNAYAEAKSELVEEILTRAQN